MGDSRLQGMFSCGRDKVSAAHGLDISGTVFNDPRTANLGLITEWISISATSMRSRLAKKWS